VKFVTLLFCLLTSTFIAAQECTMKVYGNQNKYPKVYLEDHQAKGILVDMMRYIGKEINCQFSFHLKPWKRAYLNMLEGNGAIIGLSKTSQREQIIDYSIPMYLDEVIVISHRNNDVKYNDIKDLNGRKVAYSRGASYGDKFDSAVNQKRFIPHPDSGDIEGRIRMILYKRVDVGIFGPGTSKVKQILRDKQDLFKRRDELLFHPKAFKEDLNYLGVAKGQYSQDFLDSINQAIKKGKSSGAFSRIEMAYNQ